MECERRAQPDLGNRRCAQKGFQLTDLTYWRCRTLSLGLGFLLACSAAGTGLAQNAPKPDQAVQTVEIPLLIDPAERLAKPDLTALPRFRVLTTVDFPPFSFVDQTDRLSGFNIDLVREICRELDIEAKCQLQVMPFADLKKALEEGQGEAVAAGISVDAELRQSFDFSRPYLTIPARFAASKAAALSGSAALALVDRPVGVIQATVHEEMLKSFFPRVKPVSFASRGDMLTALKERKVDAVFGDGLSLPFWIASPDSEACCILFDGPYLSEHFLGEGLSLMLRQKPAQLTQAVNYALVRLAETGKLQEIFLRYFPNGL